MLTVFYGFCNLYVVLRVQVYTTASYLELSNASLTATKTVETDFWIIINGAANNDALLIIEIRTINQINDGDVSRHDDVTTRRGSYDGIQASVSTGKKKQNSRISVHSRKQFAHAGLHQCRHSMAMTRKKKVCFKKSRSISPNLSLSLTLTV